MKQNVGKAVKIAVLTVGAFVMIFPFLWMLFTSLKTLPESISIPPTLFPAVPQFENYTEALAVAPFGLYLRNSIIVAGGGTLLTLVLTVLSAYGFTIYEFRGKKLLFLLCLSTMMIPTEVTLIPRFMLFKELGLYNTRWAIILPNWFAPGAVFMLRQFYMGLPNDLMEAAKIDGAGHPRIFAQILLPLTKAALVSQCVLSFVSCWNEYMAPLVFLVKKNLYTVAQVVQWTMMDEAARTDLTMAASTCAIIPVAIIFMFCQRYFVEGIATSGVKG